MCIRDRAHDGTLAELLFNLRKRQIYGALTIICCHFGAPFRAFFAGFRLPAFSPLLCPATLESTIGMLPFFRPRERKFPAGNGGVIQCSLPGFFGTVFPQVRRDGDGRRGVLRPGKTTKRRLPPRPYPFSRASNGHGNTSATRNRPASACRGLNTRFSVAGTSALGTRSSTDPVSYTHLDVYKRQRWRRPGARRRWRWRSGSRPSG